MPTRTLEDDPLWFKDAIIYQLHIKAFYDSNEDGIGDFRGLLEKLDYLAELGVNTIWLLPFYPSPLRDDGYDIADYFGVNPDYGNIQDVREFLREAHRRGLRVITELVMNHTSDEHEWFKRARRAKPGSALRNFYVWTDDPKKYADARIIFKDFELSNWTFDPVGQSNYWHRFYSHQPDLNFDNPQVHKAMFRVLDYWMALGVDGLRLDAVPYLYEREGTNCENLRETHEFLKSVRGHIDKRFRNRMLLAEANQWPEDAAAYFGAADECHMNFHFPLMPRMYMALQMEDRFPIIDILEQTPGIPESCQWGIFLRNHDELTLEMVTDEERDYMYRVYAKDPKARINLGIRRRLAPLLDNNRYMFEIMNVLLFTLPGTPIIYYGDEIGMGDNYYLGDRNGVRTPMQWSPDRNGGFSRANPQKLYLPVIIDPEYHYESVNVENQMRNPSSLLWWMRHMITTRKRFKAFGRGTIEFLRPENTKILAYVRRYQDEIILVVMNLSRYSQYVEMDLANFAGLVPEVVFSRTKFPVIRETPYRITLGMYGYFIFHLVPQEPEEAVVTERKITEIEATGGLRGALAGAARKHLEQRVLPQYLRTCRWFGGKGRAMTSVQIIEDIPVTDGTVDNRILLLRISYGEGAPELYLLPLGYAVGERREFLVKEVPHVVVCTMDHGSGILFDAIYDDSFRMALFKLLANRKRLKTSNGEIVASAENGVRKFLREAGGVESSVLKIEHSNTAIRYGNRYFLKLYRKLEEGINPDAEIVRHLTEEAGYAYVPGFRGDVQLLENGKEPVVMALLQDFVPNEGDAWSFTLDNVSRFFVNVYAQRDKLGEPPCLPRSLLRVDPAASSEILREMIGEFYLETVVLLGQRTAEMHTALATPTSKSAFAPEAFSLLYQRSVYQSMRSLTSKTMQALSRRLQTLPDASRGEAESILGAEKEILEYLASVKTKKFSALKTRIHGDYHLGQVLFTGKDFVIIDFEGEPARPLGERRLKRSPFKDVAGMIRSFHYAAYHVLLRQKTFVSPEEAPLLEPWADFWYHHVSAVFLHSYLEHATGCLFLPEAQEEREVLLNVFLLEKAIYELGYEMNNRPEWMPIPIRGIMNILRGCGD